MASLSAPSRKRFERSLVTPEGVDLRLTLATAGQRAGALIVDCLLLAAVLIVFTLIAFAAGLGTIGSGGFTVAAVIWLLGSFLLRNFYFIWFETGRRAATFGKRWAGLRVVARDGGRLSADAVIARNLMREIELFLPLSFLLGGEIDGTVRLVGLFWAAIFLLFPLFNADRLRVGDIVAGTWVVHAPRRALAIDLAAEGSERLAEYRFTDAQLDAYGEFELQTLETVLRTRNDQTLAAVSDTIRGKIGWPTAGDDYNFLSAYYAALSARLERRMLFGRRRRDKFDRI